MKLHQTAPFFALLAVVFTLACDPGGSVVRERALTLDDGSHDGWVGVSRDPVSGDLVLLNARAGLFELTGDGLQEIASLDELLVNAELAPQSDFTDVAALGDGSYALTALSDGFLFDGETLRQHFCYEPGFADIEPTPDPVPTSASDKQLTLSLDYLPERGQLIAQPRTFDEATGEILAAHVATFDLETGVEQGWFDLGSPEVLAGGLTTLDDDSVLLGAGAKLLRFDIDTRALHEIADLGADVQDIAGMASTDDGTVWVIDGEAGSLLEVRLSDAP